MQTTLLRGRDTWANSDYPNSVHGDGRRALASATSRVFVRFAGLPAEVRSKTVVAAHLYPVAANNIAAQTWTAHAVDSNWTGGKLTWNKQPTVRAGALTFTPGALSDGDRPELDVTNLVQQVANGAEDFGFRLQLSGAAGGRLYTFENPDSWQLVIEVSDEPQPPVSLNPDSGVVATSKPVLTWDWTDNGILDDASTTAVEGEQAAYEVQINTSATSAGAWGSGQVSSPTAQLDLAASSYPGAANGTPVFWRVRCRDVGGVWSDWSDWATWTYIPLPTLTITSPSGSLLYDTSTVIEASVSSGEILTYRVQIYSGEERTRRRYNSGRVPGAGTTLAHELDLRLSGNGSKTFPRFDRDYWLRVVVEDRVDRSSTPGDPGYVEVWKQVSFSDDAQPAVTGVWADQIGVAPQVKLRWTRTAAADAWLILRNGAPVARYRHEDVTIDPDGGWSVITSDVLPHAEAVYQVQPIVNGKKSGAGNRSAVVTVAPEGLWLIRSNGDAVVLTGVSVGGFRKIDRRATYSPPAAGYDVDIVTALGGVNGNDFTGSITADRFADIHTVDQARARLSAMRANPGDPVQLVYATVSVPVILRGLSVLPSEAHRADNQRHDVSFSFFQCDDFEESL